MEIARGLGIDFKLVTKETTTLSKPLQKAMGQAGREWMKICANDLFVAFSIIPVGVFRDLVERTSPFKKPEIQNY